MPAAFRHTDGEATIVFGPGALEAAADLIGSGYVLLTTARAEAVAPAIKAGAAAVVHVPHGQVDVVAAGLLDEVADGPLVALGGGRVIDVAKAVAAAHGLRGPVAIPTSLSGAEMTRGHRHARGVDEATPRVRASVVVNDPALSASQPIDELAASSANALAHAVAALVVSGTTPIAQAVARDAIEHLALGWGDAEPDRSQIALGALMAGWSVDRSGLGPHHALAQTAVRAASLSHARTNAALLPHTTAAMRDRMPSAFEAVDRRIEGSVQDLTERLASIAGASDLGTLGDDPQALERAADSAARRGELRRVAPPLTADEVLALYRAAAAD